MTTNTSEAYASGGAQGSVRPVLDLFAGEEGEKTVAQSHSELPPAERARRAIERVLIAGHVALLAFSAGKDSSCCANLLLNAAINVIKAGYTCPLLIVSHSDTGVESPVVRALADGELEKMRAFAEKHGLPLEIRVGRPTLSACFARTATQIPPPMATSNSST